MCVAGVGAFDEREVTIAPQVLWVKTAVPEASGFAEVPAPWGSLYVSVQRVQGREKTAAPPRRA